MALLADLRLRVREALALLTLFAGQLLSPIYDAQLEALLGLAHDPLRLHNVYAGLYLVLAVVILIWHRRGVWELRRGFRA